MKSFLILLLMLSATAGFAQQQQEPTVTPQDTGAPAGTVSHPFGIEFSGLLEHNYVDFFAFANGVWDAYPNGNQTVSSFGVSVGGGINASHWFRNGSLALAYRADYRDYQSAGTFPSGTDQALNFFFQKRLSRRWSFGNSEAAGISQYGGLFTSQQTSLINSATQTPFTPTTKFLSASNIFSYQQSLRLSYQAGTSFFLTRYNYGGPFGATGGTGFAGAAYRLTRRTTFGGTLSYSDFIYQQNAGRSRMESAYLTVSHNFSERWTASASGGLTRSSSTGTITLPVSFTFQNQLTQGYITGPYHHVAIVPYFEVTATRALQSSAVVISGGETVTPGNGFFLASRTIFVRGSYSRGLHQAILGISAAFNRLSTVSNAANTYSSSILTASYAHALPHHLGYDLTYAYVHYGTFGTLGSRNESQIGFGLTFSSKNIPVAMF